MGICMLGLHLHLFLHWAAAADFVGWVHGFYALHHPALHCSSRFVNLGQFPADELGICVPRAQEHRHLDGGCAASYPTLRVLRFLACGAVTYSRPLFS